MDNHVEDKAKQCKCHCFLCLTGSCSILNVFNLDRTKKIKPNLVAIKGKNLARKTTV